MGENRKIYAALLGAGTVGSGVYKLAGMQEEDICLKTGAQLEIKKILVRNPGKVREGIPQELFTDSWQEILEDPEIQIVIEVMGGIEPARTYVEEAMKAGKQAVTANKDLLAEYGDPLFEIATENKCDLQFEAASSRRHSHHPPFAAEPGGKPIDGDHGNRQRYDKLYFDQNVRGRYGVSRSSGYGYETGLCGSRSHSRRGRL